MEQAPHTQYNTTPGTSGTKVYYWVYWSTTYFTVLTWILAVLAAALDSWVKVAEYPEYEYETLRPSSLECDDDKNYEGSDICSLYRAAYTFQYMAMTTISFTPPIIVFASFTPAWITGRLGLALGIILAVFSVFELIAFSVGATYFSEVDDFYTTPDDDDDDYFGFDDDEDEEEVITGPTLGLAVTAWIFGVAGTILILTLRTKATAHQDGPCRKFFLPPEQQAPAPSAALTQPPVPVTRGPPPAFTEDTA